MAREGQLERFQNCFKKVYYSSLVGRRKPDVSTFQWFAETHGLEPDKVLFIDDSEQHIAGAKEAGLEAYHLKAGEEVSSLFF
jgi:putative hydrolase of the HAD superfamily